jgi:hypothetical protein
MSRGILGGLEAALASPSVTLCLFVKLEFTSGTQRYHSGIGSVTLNSESYIGVGELGAIEAVREDSRLSMKGIKIQLSGVDTTKVDLSINESIRGRNATLYLGTVDPETAVCNDYVEIFSGYMDSVQYVRSETEGAMSLAVESIMTQFDLPSVRRATNEDHQERYPGDKFFEYVRRVANTTLIWGPEARPPGPYEDRRPPQDPF